jgi:hypothetical protein
MTEARRDRDAARRRVDRPPERVPGRRPVARRPPALEEHLRGCPSCRAVLEQLRRGDGARRGTARPRPRDARVARDRRAHRRARAHAADGGRRAGRPRRQAHPLALDPGRGRRGRRAGAGDRDRADERRGPCPRSPPLTWRPRRRGLGAGDAYRVAVAQHLSRTETLLASFRADAAGGRVDASRGSGPGRCCSTPACCWTRPPPTTRLRGLLEDLELVLAQIAQLPQQPPTRTEVDLAEDALEQSRVLPRLRTLVPAGSMNESTRGES